ncbi:hypothetical protein [Terrarubrum flagellatum]
MGEKICLGGRVATCGMTLNNTSWNVTDTPCTVSEAPGGQSFRTMASR